MELSFENFGQMMTGKVISIRGMFAVVLADNPFGTRNLVLLTGDAAGTGWTAYRHGNGVVLGTLTMFANKYSKYNKKLASRVAKYLSN